MESPSTLEVGDQEYLSLLSLLEFLNQLDEFSAEQRYQDFLIRLELQV